MNNNSNNSNDWFNRTVPFFILWFQVCLLLLMLITPQVVKASGCEEDQTTEQLIACSDLIFYGKALSIDSIKGEKKRPAEITRFEVSKHYKGSKDSEISIVSRNSGIAGDYYCRFKVGEETVVFARRGKKDGQYIVSSCAMLTYRKYRMQHDLALEEYRRKLDDFIAKLQQQGQNTKLLREQIAFLMQSKSLSEAEHAYTELLKIRPDDEIALVERGTLRYQMKRYGESLLDYQAAIAVDGRNRAALRGKALSLIMLGKVNELGPGDRDFSAFDSDSIRDISFAGMDLGGAIFRDAKLSIVNFTGANLRGADFLGAKLAGANFSGADLYKSNFTGAQLDSVEFSGATIDNADFSEAKLERVSFKDLSLQSVTFKKASLYGADFSGADLSDKDLRGLEMQGAKFVNAKLNNADLTGALFSGRSKRWRNYESLHGPGPATDFRGADLTGAKLEGADLRYAIFDCKTRWPARFQFDKLLLFPVSSQECPKLIKTALFVTPSVLREMPGKIGGERSKIRGPELANQQFPEINLSGANLSGFRFWRINFSGANLVGTDFRNADLQNTIFFRANLSEADLSGATLWGADFSEAILDKATFTAAEYNEKTIWPKGFDPANIGAIKRR